jgi:hypothetical protein
MIIQVGKGIKHRAENDDMFTSSASIGDLAKSKRDNAPQSADGMASSSFDKPKRKNEFQTDETSWGTALMDVGLYALVSGSGVFLIMLFFISVMGGVFDAIANSPSSSSYGQYDMAQVAEFLQSLGLAFALIYGLLVAAISAVSYMIWFGIIHLVSTMMLGGSGSYTGILHRASIPMIVWMVVSFVLGIVGAYFSFSYMANSLADYGTYAGLRDVSGANFMSVLNAALAFGFTLWLASVIGNNYRFGMGKGCLSMIISYVVAILFACGCIYFFSAIMAQAFESSYQGFIPLMF